MRATEYVRTDESIGEAVLRWLEENLTEERTDAWAAAIAGLPFIPGFIPRFLVSKALDLVFPGVFLSVLRKFLVAIGAVNERHLDSPFRK